jgi:hypothetical protein
MHESQMSDQPAATERGRENKRAPVAAREGEDLYTGSVVVLEIVCSASRFDLIVPHSRRQP